MRPTESSFSPRRAQYPEMLRAVELLLTEDPSTVSLFGGLTLHGLGGPAGTPTIVALLAPGAELGLYRIVELLGSGGSSDVYKAYEHAARSPMSALKVFDGTRSDGGVSRAFRARIPGCGVAESSEHRDRVRSR